MDRGGLRRGVIPIIKVGGRGGRPWLAWSNGTVNLRENVVEADATVKATRPCKPGRLGWNDQ